MPLSVVEVEANKDKMDMAPVLRFVEGHVDIYRANIKRLLQAPSEPAASWAAALEFRNNPDAAWQLSPEKARWLLASTPIPLAQLSNLKGVTAALMGGVPVPNFNDEGFVDAEQACAAFVPLAEFPDGHHPTRIFVGNTYQGQIRPTAIPPTVSKDAEAVEAYQIHVLLHELWHTVEGAFRSEEAASQVHLRLRGGEVTTFADWRRRYLAALHAQGEPDFVSAYAATYGDQIKPDMDTSTIAFAEQTAEGYVGYALDILPNAKGHTSFHTSHPELWQCMDDLANSEVIATMTQTI